MLVKQSAEWEKLSFVVDAETLVYPLYCSNYFIHCSQLTLHCGSAPLVRLWNSFWLSHSENYSSNYFFLQASETIQKYWALTWRQGVLLNISFFSFVSLIETDNDLFSLFLLSDFLAFSLCWVSEFRQTGRSGEQESRNLPSARSHSTLSS